MSASAASAAARRVALVTGGNKGIGLEIVRQLASSDPSGLHVLLGARDVARGQESVKKLALPNVSFQQIDVTSLPSIQAAANAVRKAHPDGLDVLVNNAGVFLRGQDQSGQPEVIDQTMAVNYVGPRDTCLTFWPLLKKNAQSVGSRMYSQKCSYCCCSQS